jgi:hypothetical protein
MTWGLAINNLTGREERYTWEGLAEEWLMDACGLLAVMILQAPG